MPGRSKEIEALYLAAKELPPGAERDRLLGGADPQLRRDVDVLLADAGDEPTATMTAVLAPGVQIGQYRLESKLGEGGVGTVYRALDTKLNRSVAIKVLSSDLADAAARRRFQREAQLASSLNHPHILTVHDVGEFTGRQYLVTEFIDGGTLKDWIEQKRTWQEIVDLLTGVADGLAAAHAGRRSG